MGLVCNDRAAALDALQALTSMPMPNQARLEKMRGKLGQLKLRQGNIALDGEWEMAQQQATALRDRFSA
ncbi:MAG: hypothetical protein NVS3B3_21960 [Aquirhabdus sp.]